MGLVLLDQLRLKAAGTIPRCVQFKRTGAALHGFARLAVLAIGRHFLGQVGVDLRFQCSFGELLDQGRKDAVLAGDRLAGLERFERPFKIEFLTLPF